MTRRCVDRRPWHSLTDAERSALAALTMLAALNSLSPDEERRRCKELESQAGGYEVFGD